MGSGSGGSVWAYRYLCDVGGGGRKRGNASSWWRNIGRSGESIYKRDWFRDGLNRCLGKGDKTNFWEDKWLGNMAFKDAYPRLYQISEYKNKLIQDCGSWRDRKWEWDLEWRRNMFVWEKELEEELHLINTTVSNT